MEVMDKRHLGEAYLMPMQLDSWRLGNPLLEATGNKSESSVPGLKLWGSSNRNRGWLQGPANVGVQASSIFPSSPWARIFL